MTELRLSGRSALVVGGGQTPGETIGNGRATAALFARHGARMAVVDRVLARAESTVAEITAEDGTAIAVEGSVTSNEDCAAMVAAATEAFGPLDILVDNVEIAGDEAKFITGVVLPRDGGQSARTG